MGDKLSIEKGICIYLFFICGLDAAIMWPLSCLLAFELSSVNIKLLGFISGLIPFAYSCGKIVSYKGLDLLVSKMHVKWVLFILLFGLITANTLLSISTSLASIVICRFFSGLFANLQFVVRKILRSLNLYEMVNDDIFRKAYIAQRIGIILGTFLSVFLFKSELIVPSTSFFNGKVLLMLAGLLVLFQLIGLFLVLFLNTPIVHQDLLKNRYAELPEIKNGPEIDTDRQTKETPDTSNLFNISSLPIENINSEENQDDQEVKFYSPKCIANREIIFQKKIQSAKPKLEPMFNFNERTVEMNELELRDEERKIHISFIDEEFENEENSEEGEKPEPVPAAKVIKEKKQEEPSLVLQAFWFRMLLTGVNGYLVECVPALIFLQCIQKGDFFVVTVEVLCLTAAFGLYQGLVGRLMNKLSLYKQTLMFCSIPLGIFLVYPVVQYLSEDSFMFIPFWILLLFSAEALMPVGNVLVSDSVAGNLREIELGKGNMLCMGFRCLFAYLATGIVFWSQANFVIGVAGVPCALVIFFRSKLKNFIYLAEVPYNV